MKIWVFAFLGCFVSLSAKEFLYPVGYHPEEDVLFVMYQKTSSHLELWEWDPHTKQAHQLLLSRYSPAGFTLLPNYSGFSFIDNGMLKVKQLLKRSPRTIQYDAPIYNVEQVHWIDEKTCYASGRYQDYFGIFQINWDGCVDPILVQNGIDYQCPQKVDDSLFFIERTKEGYRIAQAYYSATYQEDDFSDRLISHMKNQPPVQEVLSFETTPIAFLHMVSASEGFVLSHPEGVSKNDPSIDFEYHHIFKKNDGCWAQSQLFSFAVPTSFLVNPNRLYESMLPLLPYICQNQIYYVDSSETDFLALYSFDLMRHTKKLVSAEKSQHIFGVKQCQSFIAYGGEILGPIEMTEGVRMALGIKVDLLT